MTVHEAIRCRSSVRSYSSAPIPGPVLQRMRDAIRYAPSACNNQPWRFVWVGDPVLRQKLVQVGHAAEWIAAAPWVVVACGYPQRAYAWMGGNGNSIDVDVAIAVDHLTLAATAEGLGTCWIGTFAQAEVTAILSIPAEVKVVALTPLGYPATKAPLQVNLNKSRKSEAEIFSVDRF